MKLEKIKEELTTAGIATLYFLCVFLLIIVLKKLLLAHYDISYFGLSAAVIGALIVGKVVVVLDNFRAGTRYESSRSPIISILYKTLVYSAAVLLVLAAEKTFHAYQETNDLAAALMQVWQGRERSRILATILCIALAFTGYNLFSAVNRRLANGRLAQWLIGRSSGE